MSLNLVISPYHMTTREAPSMVALLLADQAITLMPTPAGPNARPNAERLVERAPRYARLVEQWRWSVPMWNAGVLMAELNGDEPISEVATAHAEIFSSPMWSSLRQLLEQGQHDSEPAYLEALAHDLLRGGPDPALTIPVAAGLDRFAASHHAIVVRSAPVSLVQKQELRAARTMAGVTIPVLLQARSERLLDAREMLQNELDDLRDALNAAAFGQEIDDLREVASVYRHAFDANRAVFNEGDAQELRVITGEVSVRLVELSSDAVLLSSEQATRSLVRSREPTGSTDIRVAAGRTMSIVIRVIGSHERRGH